MQQLQQYRTVKGFSEFILKEKSSEFIAHVFPVETEDEYQNILNETKKKYYDASHHCYCVKVISGFVKYSDDGEPNGTAGIRILNAIDHFDLNNILVIVTRYFGGTKLGVGPLGKAYYSAAEKALDQSEKVLKHLYNKILIKADFTMVSHVYRILETHNAKILNTNYEDNIKLECLLIHDSVNTVKQQLIEMSKGNIEIENKEEFVYLS